jgi:hypothetical protein
MYNITGSEGFGPVITVVDTAPEPWMTAVMVSRLRGRFGGLRHQTGGYPHSPQSITMGGVGIRRS